MGQKPLPCARENRKMKIELVLFQIYTKLFDAPKLMADILYTFCILSDGMRLYTIIKDYQYIQLN